MQEGTDISVERWFVFLPFLQGTVVEWMVEPGQAVQPDDVVAMVETDKVTIEIKADIAGVVTKHFPAV